jgi:lipoate-protein ligase A
MKVIINKATDPHFNLSIEEYIIKNYDLEEDIIMLWRNDKTVVIGRNQNPYNEVNLEYLEKEGITLARRLSGGGAVYHDLGNLNYTIFTKKKNSFNNYKKFCMIIIDTLKYFGIKANFEGRNDIYIDGAKFSGNAQYFYQDKMFHHGTILFSVDLETLSKVLIAKEKNEDKAVKSKKSRVVNLKEINSDITIEAVVDTLINKVLKLKKKDLYTLGKEELKKIQKIKDERFGLWEWNYGRNYSFQKTKKAKFQGGTLEITFEVKNGLITQVKVYGDFFGIKTNTDLEELLLNKPYHKESLEKLFQDNEVDRYFYLITKEEIIDLLFE